MPRANIQIHLRNQEELASQHLQSLQGQRLIRAIKDKTSAGRQIASECLADLVAVPVRSLNTRKTRPGSQVKEVRLRSFGRKKAFELLRGYLPRAMGWKKVATLAKELGIHRNTVESFARKAGDPKILMYALDKRLYISPKGERVVREQTTLLNALSERLTLADCARNLGVPLNHLTAYASQRGMKFTHDPLGKTRLTNQQVEELAEWKRRLEQLRRREDLCIDRKLYCSIIKVAQDKANRISSLESPEYNHIRVREEGALRHLARTGGVATMTKLGMYIPKEYAELFVETVTVTQAAAMVGVSTSTIKKWQQRNPNLIPEPLAGKRTKGVLLPELITMAERKYDEEPKLVKRNKLPALFVTERIDALDDLLGMSYENVIDGLGVSAGVKQALLRKRGCIPRTVASALLRRLPDSYASLEGFGTIDDDRRLHRIVSCLGPKTPMIPGARLIQLIERASEARAKDPATVYKGMKNFFHLQAVWPKSFHELIQMDKQQNEIPNFPLGCGVYLYLLSDKNRGVYSSDNSGAAIIPGDIYLHRELADVGIVESSSQYGAESRAQILFMQQPAGVLFGSA